MRQSINHKGLISFISFGVCLAALIAVNGCHDSCNDSTRRKKIVSLLYRGDVENAVRLYDDVRDCSNAGCSKINCPERQQNKKR